MINQDKWVDSLPNTNIRPNAELNQIDHYRWVNTIPNKWANTTAKKNTYNVVGKYSLIAVLFICGLLFVSVVKNETRNLEKEINSLRSSNYVIEFNLDQAILDNEVITSPENISRLAKEYLNTNFISYKKSQIRQLDEDTATVIMPNTKNNNLSTKIKLKIIKSIEEKKTEIKKLQELYSNPKSIPSEIKTQVAKKIEETKVELKNLYNSPKETVTLEKAKKWIVIQVAKVFLGMPIIPGK